MVSSPTVDIRRIEEYCLSPSHPLGRNKARVLQDTLNLTPEDAPWLREVLVEAAGRIGEALSSATEAWGRYWVLDVVLEKQGKSTDLITIWISGLDENDVPTFATCWVP